MIVTDTRARRRTATRIAGAAATFSAVAVLTGGLLAAGAGAGGAVAASGDVHLASGPTATHDEPAPAAKRRRTTTSNTSDYLKVVLKEAS